MGRAGSWAPGMIAASWSTLRNLGYLITRSAPIRQQIPDQNASSISQ